jgi:hypothetical protein
VTDDADAPSLPNTSKTPTAPKKVVAHTVPRRIEPCWVEPRRQKARIRVAPFLTGDPKTAKS